MDIHRSRFVPFPSSPISAISFSRSNDKGLSEPKPALKLAIGRENGDIEIWDPTKADWVQEVVFHGGNKRNVDGLVWTQEPDDTDFEGKPVLGQLRLFSIGSTAEVTEWDLATGRPLRASTGNFTEVWCFAAQPRWRQGKAQKAADDEFRGQNIVAGCGDGTLAVLSTADNDLIFQRFLARSGSKKTRCMSVTWQNRDRVVAGFSDSTIRIYDARSGAILRNMSLGAGIPGAPRDTLIWRLKCLPNGDIVSADSNGEVRFWDGNTYSLAQRLAGHSADCLDLVTSSDGQTVFSGGMDGRIATYKLGGREGEKRRWAKAHHRRLHEGEVKSMAVYDAKSLSVVVTGGLDTTPAVIPLRNNNKENHRRLSGLPQSPPCASSPEKRLVASWWGREVSVWRIAPNSSDLEEKPRKLVARIAINDTESISSVALSSSGTLLAVSTVNSTRVFQLKPTNDTNGFRLKVRALSMPKDLAKNGARALTISSDGHWLAAVSVENEITVARIRTSIEDPKKLELLDETVELDRPHRKSNVQRGLNKYDRTITRAAFSPDSRVLVVGDLAGYLDTWILEGHFDPTSPAIDHAKHDSSAGSSAGSDSDSDSDSDDEDEQITIFHGQHWADVASSKTLPKLDSAPLVLSFRPSSPSSHPEIGNPGLHATRHNPHAHSHTKPVSIPNLFVITQHHSIHEFDLLTGKLTPWSRRNPSSVLPPEIRSIKDRAMGVVWDSDHAETARMWVYGASWVGMLDVSQDFDTPKQQKAVTAGVNGDQQLIVANGEKKRKREVDEWAAQAEKRKKVKGRSGAGDKVNEHEMGGAISGAARIGVDGQLTEMEVHKRTRQVDSDDDGVEDDDDLDDDDTLGALRTVNGETDDEQDDQVDQTRKRRKWWCTYKYRPILGMVPIGPAGNRKDGDDSPIEVVLIERPQWDLQQLSGSRD